MIKQLHKLINVVKIRDLDPQSMVACELMLLKVNAEGAKRGEVLQIAEIFKTKIVDVERRSLTLQATGETDKLAALYELFRPIGILEVVRTGTIAIGRGRTTPTPTSPHRPDRRHYRLRQPGPCPCAEPA